MCADRPHHHQSSRPPQRNPPQRRAPQQRAGDWLCLVCGNINFGSRSKCNMAVCGAKKGFPGPYVGAGTACQQSGSASVPGDNPLPLPTLDSAQKWPSPSQLPFSARAPLTPKQRRHRNKVLPDDVSGLSVPEGTASTPQVDTSSIEVTIVTQPTTAQASSKPPFVVHSIASGGVSVPTGPVIAHHPSHFPTHKDFGSRPHHQSGASAVTSTVCGTAPAQRPIHSSAIEPAQYSRGTSLPLAAPLSCATTHSQLVTPTHSLDPIIRPPSLAPVYPPPRPLDPSASITQHQHITATPVTASSFFISQPPSQHELHGQPTIALGHHPTVPAPTQSAAVVLYPPGIATPACLYETTTTQQQSTAPQATSQGYRTTQGQPVYATLPPTASASAQPPPQYWIVQPATDPSQWVTQTHTSSAPPSSATPVTGSTTNLPSNVPPATHPTQIVWCNADYSQSSSATGQHPIAMMIPIQPTPPAPSTVGGLIPVAASTTAVPLTHTLQQPHASQVPSSIAQPLSTPSHPHQLSAALLSQSAHERPSFLSMGEATPLLPVVNFEMSDSTCPGSIRRHTQTITQPARPQDLSCSALGSILGNLNSGGTPAYGSFHTNLSSFTSALSAAVPTAQVTRSGDTTTRFPSPQLPAEE